MTVWGSVFRISGNIMGRHRHPVLFLAQVGCFNLSENITGCQWQPIIFALISKTCAPYNYQDHFMIQNMKVSSWALYFQNPRPKTDSGSLTNKYLVTPLHLFSVFCPQIESTLPSTWGTFTIFYPKIEGTSRFCPQIEGTWRFLPPNWEHLALTLGHFYTFCPQIEDTLRFLPQIESTLPSTCCTFMFFAPKLRALYVFAAKLRAPCPQPGALLCVLPQNWGHFLCDRGHLGLTGEAMALSAYPLDQPLIMMVHLLIIKLNSKEIDGVPVTGIPVGSGTVLSWIMYVLNNCFFFATEAKILSPGIVSIRSTYLCNWVNIYCDQVSDFLVIWNFSIKFWEIIGHSYIVDWN